MWWIILGVVIYIIASVVHFIFSLSRKHRRAKRNERIFDYAFYPGLMVVIYPAIWVSTLFGWNK